MDLERSAWEGRWWDGNKMKRVEIFLSEQVKKRLKGASVINPSDLDSICNLQGWCSLFLQLPYKTENHNKKIDKCQREILPICFEAETMLCLGYLLLPPLRQKRRMEEDSTQQPSDQKAIFHEWHLISNLSVKKFEKCRMLRSFSPKPGSKF